MTKFVNMISDICMVNGVITARVKVPAGSVWFDGHFPGQAILPGVAQLAMVVQILGQALKKTVYAADVSRVRFKQVILPAESIEVHITPKGNETTAYGFRLLKGEALACSGFLKLSDI
jgi:3-hydroxymyristoyl/3-hydroxydecanoyl-(acyl carrier protein) dehydratase